MLNEISLFTDYHTQNRRTLDLITQIDEKIEELVSQLNELRENYVNSYKKKEKNFMKVIKMRIDIDNLNDKIMCLSETKLELVDKMSFSASFLLKSISSYVNSIEPVKEEIKKEYVTFCICGKGKSGRMVKCQNNNCEKGWFHLKCLIEKPDSDYWCCSDDCYRDYYYYSIQNN